jgi:hypothetical protein
MGGIGELLDKTWFGSVGTYAFGFVSVLALFIAVYALYRRTTGRLAYEIVEFHSVDLTEFTQDGQISVGAEARQILSVTGVVLWNEGRAPLRGVDLVTSDPLRIAFSPRAEVLAAAVSKRTRATNAVTVKRSPEAASDLLITYDFLDANDGALVHILHTSCTRLCVLTGTLIGQPEGPVAAPYSHFKISRITATAAIPRLLLLLLYGRFASLLWLTNLASALVIFLIAVVAGILARYQFFVSEPPSPTVFWTRGLYVVFSIYMLWSTRRRYPSILSPDNSTRHERTTA